MTEKERYRRAFDEVAASGMRKLEASDIMKNASVRTSPKKLGVVLMAAVIFVFAVTGAYAADIGGFKRTVQYWFHGEQIEATITGTEAGSYLIENEDGEILQGGGGVVIEADGSERPLTEEEIMEHAAQNHPIAETVDGKMLLFYGDQTIDLSERFENDICRIELPDRDGMTLYVTVRSDGALSASNEGFIDP